jgi:hypothetical protein
MATSFRRKMNFLTGPLLYKEDEGTPLCIGVAASMIEYGHKIRLLVQKTTDMSGWTAADVKYARVCACAMGFPEGGEINYMLKQCSEYKTAHYETMHRNTKVIDMLSIEMHLLYGIPFEYIRWQICARMNIEYNLRFYQEGGNSSSDSMTPEMANMLIAAELATERRILPLPAVPIFRQFQLKQLQDCVKHLRYACLRIRGDLAGARHSDIYYHPAIVDAFITTGDYTICWKRSAAQYANVNRLVVEGWEYGNIVIDASSAFWICHHMPITFSEWDADTVDDMLTELYLFPEIDRTIVQKTLAMLKNPNWNRPKTQLAAGEPPSEIQVDDKVRDVHGKGATSL